jgi:glycosyltransferase involved in cell wall biosynthesis
MMKAPFVSIVIPAYYSYTTLPACLHALHAQTYRDFEVIVVNSSQEAETANLMTAQFPDIHFYQNSSRLYPHAARNVGLDYAKGDFIVFTDPDCIADPNWLEALVTQYQSGAEIVGGSHALAQAEWLPTGIHLIKFYWILPNLKAGKRSILPTANVGYARHILDKTGRFKGSVFAGDALLAWRADQLGYTLCFLPTAIVNHHQDYNLIGILQTRYTRGDEFIRERATFFEWSHPYMVLYLVTFWLQPFLVLARAGKDTWRAGWFRAYLMTLPLQFLGHVAWTLGEVHGIIQYLIAHQSQHKS